MKELCAGHPRCCGVPRFQANVSIAFEQWDWPCRPYIICVAMHLPAGTRLDGYEILSLLGAGGMGEVYRARDSRLKRDVAVKVLPAFVTRDPERLRRFEQEAQAAAALSHPNILAIHHFGTCDGVSYLVTELLEGETLRAKLKGGPIAIRRSIDYGGQIAHGLAAAHEKGIVHRDLKPENLFVTRDGRIKILDFGLAKLIQPPTVSDNVATTLLQQTDPGIIIGTVGYMSPEQVRGEPVDHRADIFAFGAILYELLTVKRAFQRSTAVETMTAILNEDPTSISQIVPLTSSGLQRVIERCLEKSPYSRFQSASDLAFALEALSDASGPVAISSEISGSAQRSPAKLARWISIAAAVCVLAGAAYLLLSRQNGAPALRVTSYTQLTHSGNAADVIATDGVRIYLSAGISQPISQVAVTGGEIENLSKLPTTAYLNDVSPDGTTFLYQSFASGNTDSAPLYSLQIIGGAPRYLTIATTAVWSSDGKSIFYDLPNGDIFQMNADGSDSHRLFSAGSGLQSFAISPDGKTLRYFKRGFLWEATAQGANPHQLLQDWRPSMHKCCLAWSPDGSIFAFLASPEGQLWALDERSNWFHKPSRQPIALTSSPTQWGEPVFSKNGKQIFITGSTPHGELVRLDAKAGQFVPFLGGISANLLSFSRDGKTVAYATYPDGILWKSNIDGTGRVQLTDSPRSVESVSIAPDGNAVAFMARTGSETTRAYVVSSQGAGPQLLFPQDAGPESDPAWSPDGHRIAFATYVLGNNRAQTNEIRVLDVASRQVTTLPDCAGKYSPHWSPDGQYLVASQLDNSAMYVFAFRTKRWTEIYKGVSAYTSWSHDGRYIYTLRFVTDPAVLRIPANGGAVIEVADLKSVRFTGTLGLWLGLDPADEPLLLRDVGTSDVYALTLDQN